MSNITVYQQKLGALRGMLDKSKGQIAACLPKHLTPERMVRVALTAVQRTPELLECDPLSIVGSVMLASQLGLELDNVLGQAYLVPFWNSKRGGLDAQMIVGYKGYLSLARRSGEVSTFRPSIAYSNEIFTWTEGTNCGINHTPKLKDRGEPVAVYAVLQLRDGGVDFEVIPWSTILQYQQDFGTYQQGKKRGQKKPGPWWTHLEEMAKKTAIRRLAKRSPVSVEMQRAAAVDELGEAELPQFDLGDIGVTRTDEVAAQLAEIAGEPPADDDRAEQSAIESEGKS